LGFDSFAHPEIKAVDARALEAAMNVLRDRELGIVGGSIAKAERDSNEIVDPVRMPLGERV
jgi:hypothetical protein